MSRMNCRSSNGYGRKPRKPLRRLLGHILVLKALGAMGKTMDILRFGVELGVGFISITS